jgi:hypothetical protein
MNQKVRKVCVIYADIVIVRVISDYFTKIVIQFFKKIQSLVGKIIKIENKYFCNCSISNEPI